MNSKSLIITVWYVLTVALAISQYLYVRLSSTCTYFCSGAVGRKPGVRPVLDPVVARRSVGAMGERSKSGPGAEEGDEAILAVTLGEAPVLVLGDAMVDVGDEDMLWGARKGARDEKSRVGGTRSVKGVWLATCAVTRGAVAEVR